MGYKLLTDQGSLVAQTVKNLPAVRDTQAWSLGQEGPPETGKATHSSIFAWRILWIEEPGGSKELDMTEWLTLSLSQLERQDFKNCFSPQGHPRWLSVKESACQGRGHQRRLHPWGLIPGGDYLMEEEMATHSSILTWKIQWTEEPGGQRSMGTKRVVHNWATEHTHSPQTVNRFNAVLNIISALYSVDMWTLPMVYIQMDRDPQMAKII